MADYSTEEEQLENLKKWWAENGVSTVSVIVLSLAAVFGWQAWQNQQQQALYTASATYQNFLEAISANQGNPTEQQVATALHLADTLTDDYPDSGYAHFAALYKARQAVLDGEFPVAIEELQWVIAQADSAATRQDAQLRLSRVLLAQGDYSEAMASLPESSQGYAPLVEELRGDIYLAENNQQQALLAYQKASELRLQAGQASNPLLNLKIQQLESTLPQAGESSAATGES